MLSSFNLTRTNFDKKINTCNPSSKQNKKVRFTANDSFSITEKKDKKKGLVAGTLGGLAGWALLDFVLDPPFSWGNDKNIDKDLQKLNEKWKMDEIADKAEWDNINKMLKDAGENLRKELEKNPPKHLK